MTIDTEPKPPIGISLNLGTETVHSHLIAEARDIDGGRAVIGAQNRDNKLRAARAAKFRGAAKFRAAAAGTEGRIECAPAAPGEDDENQAYPDAGPGVPARSRFDTGASGNGAVPS